jgi:hypothetical protein
MTVDLSYPRFDLKGGQNKYNIAIRVLIHEKVGLNRQKSTTVHKFK